MIGVVVRGLVELLWPPRTECLFCGGPLSELCEGVAPGGPWHTWTCETCWGGMAFPAEYRGCCTCRRPLAGPGEVCGECAAGGPIELVWALGLHEGSLRESIHHLKYNGRDNLGLTLGERLGQGITQAPACVVPVPLHPSRLRERGYNQAARIAAGICRVLRVPLVEDRLVRLRSTGHQAKLSRSDRLQNLSNAFGLSTRARTYWRNPGPGLIPPWHGSRVLLVDDVLTTGATAAAAARVLRESGARSVHLAVLAVSTTPTPTQNVLNKGHEMPDTLGEVTGFAEE